MLLKMEYERSYTMMNEEIISHEVTENFTGLHEVLWDLILLNITYASVLILFIIGILISLIVISNKTPETIILNTSQTKDTKVFEV